MLIEVFNRLEVGSNRGFLDSTSVGKPERDNGHCKASRVSEDLELAISMIKR